MGGDFVGRVVYHLGTLKAQKARTREFVYRRM
jgi:hypothetical protein